MAGSSLTSFIRDVVVVDGGLIPLSQEAADILQAIGVLAQCPYRLPGIFDAIEFSKRSSMTSDADLDLAWMIERVKPKAGNYILLYEDITPGIVRLLSVRERDRVHVMASKVALLEAAISNGFMFSLNRGESVWLEYDAVFGKIPKSDESLSVILCLSGAWAKASCGVVLCDREEAEIAGLQGTGSPEGPYIDGLVAIIKETARMYKKPTMREWEVSDGAEDEN